MSKVTAKDKRNVLLKKWVAKKSEPPLFRSVIIAGEKAIATDRHSIIVLDAPGEDDLIKDAYDGKVYDNAKPFEWRRNIIDKRDAAYSCSIVIDNPRLLQLVTGAIRHCPDAGGCDDTVALINQGKRLYLYTIREKTTINMYIGWIDQIDTDTDDRDWVILVSADFLEKFFGLCVHEDLQVWSLSLAGTSGQPGRMMLERNAAMVFTALKQCWNMNIDRYPSSLEPLRMGVTEAFGEIPGWPVKRQAEVSDFLD